MGDQKLQPWSAGVWELARKQHGVVTRRQLIELGMGPKAIRHRLANGRLHPLMRGIYAVGRPQVGTYGHWMAAVLACGPQARLSHRSAATLWGVWRERRGGQAPIEVVVPASVARRRPGVRVHRRGVFDVAGGRVIDEIPVTDPIATLVDLATCIPIGEVEAAVNEADHLDLVNPERLRRALDLLPRRPGVTRLRALLDAPTFALTDSKLERYFLPIAYAAGLPLPQTQVWLNRYRVDFYWPELGLVVEADSLRYHRTPAKQAADNRRDQAHISAGLMPLRFSHWQVRYEPDHVRRTLATVLRRLTRESEKFGPR